MKQSERKKRLRQATPAKRLVGKVIDGYHLGDDLRVVRLHLEWRRLVGPRMAARTRPDGLRDEVLRVKVWDASWLHQLSMIKDQIIGKINEGMGDPPMVTELRMSVGRVRPRDQMPSPRGVRRPPLRSRFRIMPEPASDERDAEIAAEAAAIEDPELRDLLTGLRRRWDL